MKKVIPVLLFFFTSLVVAQTYQDTTNLSMRGMNVDAIYNRPFLLKDEKPIQLGGYIEANSNYFGSEGETNGLSFNIPRLNFFISSNLHNRVKFLSEFEIENNGKNISIAFAAIDVEIHPLLNVRGGIILNPIGAFNQNRDGPRWEFVDRPLSATTIIPSTLSNLGFGLFGKTARNNLAIAYELYISNGFDESILETDQNRTWLPGIMENSNRFGIGTNNNMMTTAKVSFQHLKIAEVGFSWMGGAYDQIEGNEQRVDVFALNLNTSLPFSGTRLTGEYVWSSIDIPSSLPPNFGSAQAGGHMDIVQKIMTREILNWPNATVNLALRLEYVDYNQNKFETTNEKIFDHRTAFVPALSFRPTPLTVFRFNIRSARETDLFGNPPDRTLGYQFGFSSYF